MTDVNSLSNIVRGICSRTLNSVSVLRAKPELKDDPFHSVLITQRLILLKQQGKKKKRRTAVGEAARIVP